jgi:uncharacterized protein YpmB
MSRLLALPLAVVLGLWCIAAFVGCDDKKKGGDADEEVEEKQIDVAKVPAAAMTSIKKEIGESTTIKRVLIGQKRGKPYYEAKYNDPAGKRMMVQVAEDGKVYKKVEDDDPEPK